MKNRCDICYLDLDGKKVAFCNNCGSPYHRECIQKAVSDNNSCPVCKESFVDPSIRQETVTKAVENEDIGGTGVPDGVLATGLLMGSGVVTYVAASSGFWPLFFLAAILAGGFLILVIGKLTG